MAATKHFEYKALNRAGRKVKGKVQATDPATAVTKVRKMGLMPTKVKPAGQGLNAEIPMPGANSVSLKHLAVMSRQFATMINSGLSLIRSLAILAEQAEAPALGKALDAVKSDIESGSSLSNAMAKHDKVFPPIFINMVRAGEVGGFLDKVLLQVADSFEKEVKLQNQVKSAMAYPTVVFGMAILSVTGMLLFIVPIFAKMFADVGAQLPWMTRMMVSMSEGLKSFGPFVAVLAVVAIVVWQKVKRKDEVRQVVDPWKLRMPIFGTLTSKIAIARFSRNFATMLASGVPILQCLSIVGSTSGNYVIEQAVIDVQDAVKRGDSVTDTMQAYRVFPSMMVQMMAVGEDTGALDEMLHKLSDFYEADVEATTAALASIIEPIMIAVLGVIIGGMIVGLYMPLFEIFNHI